jgi:hypothetical protein
LRQLIETQLPIIRIENLLAKVDTLTHFSAAFTPLKGSQSSEALKVQHLYAALIAHGTNIGIYGMSHSTEGIASHQLRDISQACVREQTLKQANDLLIN